LYYNSEKKQFNNYYKNPIYCTVNNSRYFIENETKPPIQWFKTKSEWLIDFRLLYKEKNLTVEKIGAILKLNNIYLSEEKKIAYNNYQLRKIDNLRIKRRENSLKKRREKKEQRLADYKYLNKYQILVKYEICKRTYYNDIKELKKRAEQGKLQSGADSLFYKLQQRNFVIERLNNIGDFKRLIGADKGLLRHCKSLFKKFNLTAKKIYSYKQYIFNIIYTNCTAFEIKNIIRELDDILWWENLGSDIYDYKFDKTRIYKDELLTKLNIWRLINYLSEKI
jgi:hypothetical protein